MIEVLQSMAINCLGGIGKEGKVGVLPSMLKNGLILRAFFEKQQCTSRELMGENY